MVRQPRSGSGGKGLLSHRLKAQGIAWLGECGSIHSHGERQLMEPRPVGRDTATDTSSPVVAQKLDCWLEQQRAVDSIPDEGLVPGLWVLSHWGVCSR